MVRLFHFSPKKGRTASSLQLKPRGSSEELTRYDMTSLQRLRFDQTGAQIRRKSLANYPQISRKSPAQLLTHRIQFPLNYAYWGIEGEKLTLKCRLSMPRRFAGDLLVVLMCDLRAYCVRSASCQLWVILVKAGYKRLDLAFR